MATTTEPTQRAPIERTEHPHIVKSADTLGGEPRVEGTRISVLQIRRMFEGGMSVGEIVEGFPDLSPAQIHDALSYAHDHPDEMAFHRERHKIRNVMRDLDWVLVGGRLIPRERLRPEDVPAGVVVYTWETLPSQEDE
jgi:uncharacterized protein (DUF433 family)